jgi:PAH dioxygenase small subunit
MQDTMREHRPGAPVGNDAYVDIQRFLYREADLLDARAYKDWLALLTDDIQYRITARVIREAAASSQDYDVVDEDAAGLKRRVEQIGNPKLTHAENPPSFTRRFVSNLQAVAGDGEDAFLATSNVMLYRQRLESPEGGLYVGRREDLLRRVGSELRLARRHVRLDHAAFPGSVTTLF